MGTRLIRGIRTVDTLNTEPQSQKSPESSPPSPEQSEEGPRDLYAQLRRRMVDEQIAARGVDNQRVLDTLRHVPRHKFVPDHFQHLAYHDSPLTIGHSQTISQPLIVAMMTQLANPTVESKALDVGTGSGYQAAVLSKIVKRVYSVEILEPLAVKARERLRSLEYNNIEIRCGDGCHGWPKEQPFDVIIVAAAPDHVPEPLIDQLAPGGILVIPVGPQHGQSLLVIEKQIDGSVRRRNVAPVTFVPMTGKALKETKNRD